MTGVKVSVDRREKEKIISGVQGQRVDSVSRDSTPKHIHHGRRGLV